MPSCRRINYHWLPWLFIAWCYCNLAYAEGIQIRNATLEWAEEGAQLNADIDIQLNQTLIDALNRGVPLYFLTELEINRPRWYLINQTLLSQQRSVRLAYNALTRQYRLSYGNLYQNFDRLEHALRVLGRLRSWSINNSLSLKSNNAPLEASLRLRLDMTKLPKPFQVTALSSKDWQLTAEWYRWKVEN